MKRSTLLPFALALAAVAALAGAAFAAGTVPDDQTNAAQPANEIEGSDVDEVSGAGSDATTVDVLEPAPSSGEASAEPAEPYEGPGTVDEPVYACLTVEGREVCDTFGESDEGLGSR